MSPRFRSASTSHFSLDTPKTLLTVVHLRRHLGQHGLHGIKRCPVPSRHHRRAVARPLFSPRHSHADVANALLRDLSRAPLGVLVPLVPSVDDDVARLEARIKQPGNGAVDGGSGLDKDDDAAGYGERFFFSVLFFSVLREVSECERNREQERKRSLEAGRPSREGRFSLSSLLSSR